ncbi:MAG: hypothetical protein V4612_00220 [Pseudomonadota bacterium]
MRILPFRFAQRFLASRIQTASLESRSAIGLIERMKDPFVLPHIINIKFYPEIPEPDLAAVDKIENLFYQLRPVEQEWGAKLIERQTMKQIAPELAKSVLELEEHLAFQSSFWSLILASRNHSGPAEIHTDNKFGTVNSEFEIQNPVTLLAYLFNRWKVPTEFSDFSNIKSCNPILLNDDIINILHQPLFVFKTRSGSFLAPLLITKNDVTIIVDIPQNEGIAASNQTSELALENFREAIYNTFEKGHFDSVLLEPGMGVLFKGIPHRRAPIIEDENSVRDPSKRILVASVSQVSTGHKAIALDRGR